MNLESITPRLVQALVFLSLIASVSWAVYSVNKEFIDYTEKCIHGHIILISHSGGIAGPLGECNE